MRIRDDVCILLNEREPLKKKLAEELSSLLDEHDISSTRLPAEGPVQAIVLERNPRIIVLDYILGDVATGLDVVEAMHRSAATSSTAVIFWTDEPSVNVAVAALKFGAVDFIPMEQVESINRVLHTIRSSLSTDAQPLPPTIARARAACEILSISQSRPMRQCLNKLTSLARRRTPLVLLSGPRGSGKSLCARHYYMERSIDGTLFELDYEYIESLDRIFGAETKPHETPLLSNGATVVIDHAEEDDGSLLRKVEQMHERIWSNDDVERMPSLVIATANSQDCEAWSRLTLAEVVEIPCLADRNEDLWPYLESWIRAIKRESRVEIPSLSNDLLRAIQDLEWAGEMQQLKDVIFEAAILESDSATTQDVSGLSKSEARFMQAILDAHSRWVAGQSRVELIPTTAEIRTSLAQNAGDVRYVAASFGITVRALRERLYQPEPNGAHP